VKGTKNQKTVEKTGGMRRLVSMKLIIWRARFVNFASRFNEICGE